MPSDAIVRYSVFVDTIGN